MIVVQTLLLNFNSDKKHFLYEHPLIKFVKINCNQLTVNLHYLSYELN